MSENIVRTLLEALDLSTSDLARLVGVTPRAVSLWLSAQREIPGPLHAYARLLLSLPRSIQQAEIERVAAKKGAVMKPYKYFFLLWQFISALDSGKYDHIDYYEVYNKAEKGRSSELIKELFDNDFDLSFFESTDWDVIDETWAGIANAVDAARKFGVQNRGLSLLMAYTLQSIQMAERPG